MRLLEHGDDDRWIIVVAAADVERYYRDSFAL